MGYYQKFHKKNNNRGFNNNGNNWQKPSYRKPPYDPAKEAEKKLKEEEKRLTHEQLEKYIPIFNSLDILHCVGMFNKIRKKITKQSRQILKMLIVNKLLYHNPMIPWEGEIPDEVKEVNEYIEFLKIKNLEYTGKEKPENQWELNLRCIRGISHTFESTALTDQFSIFGEKVLKKLSESGRNNVQI